jgi:hypothetical protein
MSERNVSDDLRPTDEEVCLWSVGEPGEAELFVCRKADLARLTEEAWGEGNDAFVSEARCHDPSDILDFEWNLDELQYLPAWALQPLAGEQRLYRPDRAWPLIPIDPKDPQALAVVASFFKDNADDGIVVRVKASEILAHAEQHGLFLL